RGAKKTRNRWFRAVQRCPLADARCRSEAPALRPLDGGQRVACHAVEEGREGEWDGAAVVQEVVR
ncbi:MAG TPA: hypothetical protein PLZ11_14325, partial [Thauera sp.]|nr:hypothetical protein [Thauera sp.]